MGYYLFDTLKAGNEISLKSFFVKLYSSNLQAHLWYLYLYIAYLAVIPFLKSLVKGLDDKYFYYMFFIAIFFEGILPVSEYLIGQNTVRLYSYLQISWLLNYAVLYPCLGYFMQHRLRFELLKKYLPWLWMANVLGIVITCYMTYYRRQITGDVSQSALQAYHSSFVVINCVTIFMTIRLLFERRKLCNIVQSVVQSVGSCTFGIYLWHLLVMEKIGWDSIRWLRSTGLNYMICAFLMCLLTMIISYITTLVLSKIPVVRKIVGF